MSITREILGMFEINQKQKITFSVDNHFDECPLSQQRSVPTDRQTFRCINIYNRKAYTSLCGYTPSGEATSSARCPGWLHKGADPQRVSTEIIIEMKQSYSGRIASNPFIASNRRYMVFPLRDHFFIKNGL